MTERETADLQRRAAALRDRIFSNSIAERPGRGEIAELIDDLVAAIAVMPPHRCSGCGHRWQGELKGAELCGECWRKAQPILHTRETPEPFALEQRLRDNAELAERIISVPLPGTTKPLYEVVTALIRVCRETADAIAALTQAKADAEARCAELKRINSELVGSHNALLIDGAKWQSKAEQAEQQRAVLEGALRELAEVTGHLRQTPCPCSKPKPCPYQSALAPPTEQARQTEP